MRNYVTKTQIKGCNYKIYVTSADNQNLNFTASAMIQCDSKQLDIILPIDSEDLLKTTLHELVHGYLYECGLKEWCCNEILVDWFANHIEQIYKSAVNLNDSIIKHTKQKAKKKCKS